MLDATTLRPEDTEAYLLRQSDKDLLRFITCGSVDDGKSTLIGRLLFDSKQIFEDQLAALGEESRRWGTTGEEMDLALLVDGLAAEREQGITIDVAYRFFTTEKRKFIVADTPGHEQYTRNMVTGASTAELAVILVDARKGILTQTRRHSFLVSLLGIRQVVLAVNKMDLVDFSQGRFEDIVSDYLAFTKDLGFEHIDCIPLSARDGDNVISSSPRTPWYDGRALLQVLEEAPVGRHQLEEPFRFPVQWVNRPNLDFRGYSGTITSGRVKVGDEIVVLPSARTTRVKSIVTYDGELQEAIAGQAVTLCLADEVDVSRGDMIAAASARPETADQFAAHLVWMSDEPLFPGRKLILQLGPKQVPAQVTEIKHAINVNTMEHTAAKQLGLNEIAVCNVATDQPLPFAPYKQERENGAFILIDRMTNATVGCGMIDFALRRATNVHWQEIAVDKQARSALKGQRAAVLWFTGLSGSGKSTVANALEKKLLHLGHHSYLLDGDNVRHGLNRDLGFTDVDRVENIRRVGEVAKLFVDAGLLVLVSFISPFRSERQIARELVEAGEFIEIYVNTPLEVCEARDPKGLYRKARAGELKNFTGIDSPYEPPENPEMVLNGGTESPDAMADQIIEELRRRGII